MIDLIKAIFGTKGDDSHEVADKTDPPDVSLAACALLLEMAAVDEEFSDNERDSILSILQEEFGLSEKHARELAEAAELERESSLDLWKFTNLINKNFSVGQKIKMVELLWRVIYADGKLDKHEDYLVHKLSRMIRLKHSQLIDAKVKVLRS